MKRTCQKKKIRYIATHRGTREADLIFGEFIKEKLDKLTTQDLCFFESFFTLPDDILMNFFLKKEPLPKRFQSPLLEELRSFVLKKETPTSS